MREYGSEHPAITLPDGYFTNLSDLKREITYLRSGREALLYVAYNCKKNNDDTILVPSYCCWSMTAPFEKSGWKIIYYRLNEDLTIDLNYLDELLKNRKATALMTMNFFGAASTRNAIAHAKNITPEITIIEDFSHCTFSIRQIFDENVDYYVSSIRKSIGVCDGAIVLSKNTTDRALLCHEDSAFATKRYTAQNRKQEYAHTKDAKEKENFLDSLRQCEHELDEFSAPTTISQSGMKMLTAINGGQIAKIRRDNMRHAVKRLSGKLNMLKGIEGGGYVDEAPFSLPILVESRDEIQKKLASNGLYAPVLWPISEEARCICSVAAGMADRMLSIPIDQRYNYDDIEDICNIILSVV